MVPAACSFSKVSPNSWMYLWMFVDAQQFDVNNEVLLWMFVDAQQFDVNNEVLDKKLILYVPL